TAELDPGLALNEIGLVTVSTSQPLVFDPYTDNRSTGSFIVIDPATNFTAGAGMIVRPLRDHSVPMPRAAPSRIARAAREAGSEAEAVDEVRRLLEELLI